MITFKSGNILDDDADVLTIPVNCVGVMGKGLALDFKKRFPWMFLGYQMDCSSGRLRIGCPTTRPLCVDRYPKNGSGWALFFPTKSHWKEQSELTHISSGLAFLRDGFKHSRLNRLSIAIPKLGCGLGGLKWEDVRPLIVVAFDGMDVDVRIYGDEQ